MVNRIVTVKVVARRLSHHGNDWVNNLFARLQQLIGIFHMIGMEDSSDLAPQEQFLR
jgi:hypothetical protein